MMTNKLTSGLDVTICWTIISARRRRSRSRRRCWVLPPLRIRPMVQVMSLAIKCNLICPQHWLRSRSRSPKLMNSTRKVKCQNLWAGVECRENVELKGRRRRRRRERQTTLCWRLGPDKCSTLDVDLGALKFGNKTLGNYWPRGGCLTAAAAVPPPRPPLFPLPRWYVELYRRIFLLPWPIKHGAKHFVVRRSFFVIFIFAASLI